MSGGGDAAPRVCETRPGSNTGTPERSPCSAFRSVKPVGSSPDSRRRLISAAPNHFSWAGPPSIRGPCEHREAGGRAELERLGGRGSSSRLGRVQLRSSSRTGISSQRAWVAASRTPTSLTGTKTGWTASKNGKPKRDAAFIHPDGRVLPKSASAAGRLLRGRNGSSVVSLTPGGRTRLKQVHELGCGERKRREGHHARTGGGWRGSGDSDWRESNI